MSRSTVLFAVSKSDGGKTDILDPFKLVTPESIKHVILPWIQISPILTFLTLASLELQNLSNKCAIYSIRFSDMEVKSK